MAATSPDQEDKRERRRSRKDGGESSRKKMKRKRKRSHHRHKRRRRERSPSGEDDGYSSSASNHSSSSASPSSSSRSSSISSRRRGRHRSRRGDDRKHSRRHQENNTSLTSSRHRSRSPSPDNRRKNTRDNHHPHRSPPPMRKRRSDSRDHHDKRRRHRHKSSDGRSSNYDDDKSQQKHKRKRKHRSSSSGSSKDDTTGHFKGGRGTLVGDHYRILRDVGLGTFGRVVQCEYVNKDDRHSNRVSDSRSSSKHRSSSRDRRDGNGKHGNGKKQNNASSKNSNSSKNNNNNTVAIKIVRNVRRYYESALIEGDICERVNREQSRQNKDFCARMIDRFSLPSTGHYCLVFECLGMSLYDFLKRHSYRPFPMYCVQDFARQMLEAVDFLHGFHLIHTDLKPENILLSNNEETTHRLWDGKTQRVPVSTKVKMIDFGGATYNDEKKSSIINTRQYRAPEVILGWGWSYPSDLWSVGCIIAELYRGELLFATHDNAEHLALMERAVGPFPRECLDKSTNSLTRECFDTRGWHKIGAVLSPRSIEHVRKMAPVEMLVDERDRRSGLGQLLRSLLMIDPKRRATAREALMSPFFANRIGC